MRLNNLTSTEFLKAGRGLFTLNNARALGLYVSYRRDCLLWGPCECVSLCCASGAFAVLSFIHSFIRTVCVTVMVRACTCSPMYKLIIPTTETVFTTRHTPHLRVTVSLSVTIIEFITCAAAILPQGLCDSF